MKKIFVKIELFSYWHIGSGFGRGADADAVVLKTATGLPYIPGRTIKGLFREALQTMEDFLLDKSGITGKMFGHAAEESCDGRTVSGRVYFSDAHLPERKWLETDGKGLIGALYKNFASTSIAANGIANDSTLRTMELVIPAGLETIIECGDEGDAEILEEAAALIHCLGSHRNRGLGRCRVTVEKEEAAK